MSIQAISQLIKRGSLKTVEIGGRFFLNRDEVETFEPSKGGRPKKERRDTSKRPANRKRPPES